MHLRFFEKHHVLLSFVIPKPIVVEAKPPSVTTASKISYRHNYILINRSVNATWTILFPFSQAASFIFSLCPFLLRQRLCYKIVGITLVFKTAI